MQSYQTHPHANVMPAMMDAEFESLKADILKNGQHESIKLLDGIILDGRHRYRACRDLDLQPKVETWTGKDSLEYVLSVNLQRRHLSESQRAMAAAEVATLPKGANQHTAVAAPSQQSIAKLFAVSTDSIQRGKKVIAQGSEALIEQVRNGEISVAKAAELVTLSKNKQAAALKASERETLANAAEIRAKRGEVVKQKRIEVIQTRIENNKALKTDDLGGPFSLIYADPAWRYAATGKSGSRLRIENQYPTMTTAEICALPVEDICDKDAMLFLWVPSSLLRDGLDVITAWGFEYVTQAVWNKTGKAPFMGGVFQQAHESLLVASRGSGLPVPRAKDKISSVIEAPRGKHSQKPELMYALFEKMYPAFKDHFVELFARNTRKGWASWGNEV